MALRNRELHARNDDNDSWLTLVEHNDVYNLSPLFSPRRLPLSGMNVSLVAVHSPSLTTPSADVYVELCNSFGRDLCKVPRNCCDGSTVIRTFVVAVVVLTSRDWFVSKA